MPPSGRARSGLRGVTVNSGRAAADHLHDEILVHEHGLAVDLAPGLLEDRQRLVVQEPDADIAQDAHRALVDRLYALGSDRFGRAVMVLRNAPGHLVNRMGSRARLVARAPPARFRLVSSDMMIAPRSACGQEKPDAGRVGRGIATKDVAIGSATDDWRAATVRPRPRGPHAQPVGQMADIGQHHVRQRCQFIARRRRRSAPQPQPSRPPARRSGRGGCRPPSRYVPGASPVCAAKASICPGPGFAPWPLSKPATKSKYRVTPAAARCARAGISASLVARPNRSPRRGHLLEQRHKGNGGRLHRASPPARSSAPPAPA